MVNIKSSVGFGRVNSKHIDAEGTVVSGGATQHPPNKAPSLKTKASSLASSLISSLGGGSGGSKSVLTSSDRVKSRDLSSVSFSGDSASSATLPTGTSSLTDPGAINAAPQQKSSKLLFKDAVLVREASDSDEADNASDDGSLFGSLLRGKYSNAGNSSAAGGLKRQTTAAPAAAGSGEKAGTAEPYYRQKSKVSFFLEVDPGESGPISSATASAGQQSTGKGRGVTVEDNFEGHVSDDEDFSYKRCHTIALGELKSTESSSSAPGQLNRPNSIKSSITAALTKLAVNPDGVVRRDESASPGTEAVRYKQNHGYLPSCGVSAVGSSLLSAAGRAGAEDDDEESLEDDDSLLPALPPGAIPSFTAVAATSNSNAGATHYGCASAIAAAAADADQQLAGKRTISGTRSGKVITIQASCSSRVQTAEETPQQQNPNLNIPRNLALVPANTPGSVLLAVNPMMPPKMQRAAWSMSDFVIHKKLYDGYASTIYKAMDRQSGRTVCLKLYHMSKLNTISTHQVAREVRLHIGMDHENIIALYAAFQEAGSVVLVQEFAGGGDLWSYMDSNSGRLSERTTVSLILQPFLKALQYLHFVGIVHRDIKPENVLFTSDMVLKVADFGLALSTREERAVTRVGTLDYMAPEVLRCPLKRNPGDNKDRVDLHYSQAVDAWAVGILAYELMTGRAPFSAAGASDQAIEAAIQTAAPSFPSRMSDPAVAFITMALHKNPALRPNILQLLHHPWIRSFQRSSSTGRRETRSEPGQTTKPPVSKQPSMFSQLVSKLSRNFDDGDMTGYACGTR